MSGKRLTTLIKSKASHEELLDSIPPDMQESTLLDISTSPTVMLREALILHWNTGQYSFYIGITHISLSSVAMEDFLSAYIASQLSY